MSRELLEAINDRLEESRLPCNQAFAAAKVLGVDAQQVGEAANDAGIRISRCQLGLFGYGPKQEGKHKIVQAMDEVPEPLAAQLRERSRDGGITCAEIWEVADGLGTNRLHASSAVEALGFHVTRCQLGCFPRPKG